MGKFVVDHRRKRKHKWNPLRERLRQWLGINATEMKLHDTRELLFRLQDSVSGKGEKQLRNKAKIIIEGVRYEN